MINPGGYEIIKLKKSSATYSKSAYEVAGGSLFSFQKAGVDYIISTPRCLVADDMGVGKTIQAIAACNVLKPRNVLIICPASLKINWAREWDRFSTLPTWPKIINYDILKKNSEEIHAVNWDVLILDECHMLKNPKAQRTKEVFGFKEKYQRGFKIPPIIATRVMALTGTPILNKPIELFPLLRYLSPDNFWSVHKYALKYCGAVKNHFGWDYSGSSNLDELQTFLRSSIMLRRMKKDVLHELPEKIRQVIEFDVRGRKKILKKEAKIFDFLKGIDNSKLSEAEYRKIIKTMESPKAPGFEDLSTVRQETIEAKFDMCLAHLEELADSKGKVIIFCHHIDIAKRLQEHFGQQAVMLIGSTSMAARQKAVDSFQNDTEVKYFIGNLKAAGVGITLTAASTVVFLELDWVPGIVSQAEDRAYRIGQKNSVLVQHLVLAESLDCYMSRLIVQKQEMIERAVDTNLISEEIRELLK